MRWLLVVLLMLLALLQYRLWFAEGSLAERHRLEAKIEELQRINRQLGERNAILERDVLELKTGNAGIEQRARSELGMIRKGEVFYQIVEPTPAPPAAAAADSVPQTEEGQLP
jgi:cell division protein FtsB